MHLKVDERPLDRILCERWSSFFLAGAVLAILGVLALSSIFITTMATVLFLGVLLVAAGITLLIHSFYTSEWRGFFGELILGLISMMVGWLLISNPALGAVSLTLVLGSYFIASGIFKTISSLFIHVEHWGWLLLNGVVSFALGILILAQWPAASLWILGLFVGIDLLMSGWTSIIYGFMLRKRCHLTKPVAVTSERS